MIFDWPAWPRFAPTDAHLISTWPHLGPNLPQLGPTWPQLGPNLPKLGPNLASTCPNLAPTWTHFAPTWRHLGRFQHERKTHTVVPDATPFSSESVTMSFHNASLPSRLALRTADFQIDLASGMACIDAHMRICKICTYAHMHICSLRDTCIHAYMHAMHNFINACSMVHSMRRGRRWLAPWAS